MSWQVNARVTAKPNSKRLSSRLSEAMDLWEFCIAPRTGNIEIPEEGLVVGEYLLHCYKQSEPNGTFERLFQGQRVEAPISSVFWGYYEDNDHMCGCVYDFQGLNGIQMRFVDSGFQRSFPFGGRRWQHVPGGWPFPPSPHHGHRGRRSPSPPGSPHFPPPPPHGPPPHVPPHVPGHPPPPHVPGHPPPPPQGPGHHGHHGHRRHSPEGGHHGHRRRSPEGGHHSPEGGHRHPEHGRHSGRRHSPDHGRHGGRHPFFFPHGFPFHRHGHHHRPEFEERPERPEERHAEEQTLEQPRYELFVLASEMVIEIQVPGFKRENLQVEIDHQDLIVKGHRIDLPVYLARERTREFHLTIALQVPVQESGISAKLDDGILVVRLPKIVKREIVIQDEFQEPVPEYRELDTDDKIYQVDPEITELVQETTVEPEVTEPVQEMLLVDLSHMNIQGLESNVLPVVEEPISRSISPSSSWSHFSE
ncbi:hypothetical protein EDD86DRAFT_213980 [Gorgonomyces haynaldii]|nr:hypothetical protein EDD86DRAFT_213980 [Gorgonomyces haynaldii]